VTCPREVGGKTAKPITANGWLVPSRPLVDEDPTSIGADRTFRAILGSDEAIVRSDQLSRQGCGIRGHATLRSPPAHANSTACMYDILDGMS
jgi:hypothetical protein